MEQKDIQFGIRPVSSKQIVKAGLTLGIGHLILPLIPFKEARTFEPFKDLNKSKDFKKQSKGGKK